MSGSGIVVIFLVAGVLTAAASALVFRTIGVELRRRHLEVGTAVFLQLGVIYAVFLAFVFGQALTSFVAADDAVYAECAALHGASIIASSLPEPARTQLSTAMTDYDDAVVDDEWQTMRDSRLPSPRALAREEALLRLANTLDLKDAKDARSLERIVTLLIEAHKNREERLFQAGQGIPAGLWAMILVYCVTLILLVCFSSLEILVSHVVVSGVFGALNALVLLAVFALQYPFEGPFRLSPDNFRQTQAKIAATFANEPIR